MAMIGVRAAGTRRQPIFAYVTEVDPAQSTFAWKIVGLAQFAVLIPLVGALLPRGAPARWPYVAAVCAVGVVMGVGNVASFVQMVRSEGYASPAPIVVLSEAILATISAAVMSYAIGGEAGIYQPLLFVPLLLIAMIGNRWMIGVTWVVAVVSVAMTAAQSGVIDKAVGAYVLSYGGVWGIAAIMVHLLALAALHSDRQIIGLAEAAGIAAQANTLVEGTERLLPVIAEWSDAKRVGAYRAVIPGEGAPGDNGNANSSAKSFAPERITAWPTIAEIEPPRLDEVRAAHAKRGVALDGDRGVLVAESDDRDALIIVLTGVKRPAYEQLMTRFNLERMVTQVRVLHDRSRHIAGLETLGQTDGLTGIPNRRALNDQLISAHASAQRRGEKLSIVMIDLDHFKAFNDSFGHLAGDDLLRAFAHRIRSRLRGADFVARYGGEEFCMILSDTDGAGAERLCASLRGVFERADDMAGVTFTAGIAEWDGSEDAESLIGRADRALYAAKDAGRNQSVVDTLATR